MQEAKIGNTNALKYKNEKNYKKELTNIFKNVIKNKTIYDERTCGIT